MQVKRPFSKKHRRSDQRVVLEPHMDHGSRFTITQKPIAVSESPVASNRYRIPHSLGDSNLTKGIWVILIRIPWVILKRIRWVILKRIPWVILRRFTTNSELRRHDCTNQRAEEVQNVLMDWSHVWLRDGKT